jgi:nucleoside-diphosphate-sugar epimerase
MATYLVTGAAGFIGSRVANRLLEQGHRVVGIDNLNDYYDVRLKTYRLEKLKQNQAFKSYTVDIERREELSEIFSQERPEAVLNLAARAGVRRIPTSISQPMRWGL